MLGTCVLSNNIVYRDLTFILLFHSYDSAELVSLLRNKHHLGQHTAGLNMTNGTVGDMAELGVTEPLKLKLQVLLSAAEAAEMILRVDEIIKCAPRARGGAGGRH
jgi:T-complex protein 1 subunit beta